MANSNMPLLFPTQSCLNEVFANQSPFSRPAPKPRSSEYPLKRPIFSAWSVAETAEAAKAKAGQLTDAAVDKYEKASAKAQAKTGGIELYSGKYYAACTVGGILACVCSFKQYLDGDDLTSAGYHTYCSYTARSSQMSSPGRPQLVQEQYTSMASDWQRRRHSGDLHRLGPNLLRLLSARSCQVWFLRILQAPIL